jgi:hypothetical protein
MGVSNVVYVHPSVPAETIPEFIAYAKANPGKINMGSGGNGSSGHMVGELFKLMAGVDLIHVPYRGQGPAMNDLLGGQLQVIFATTPGTTEYVRIGKLRALAVTTRTRADALPEVPTVADFVPGYESSQWYGVGAPKNTPVEIVEKLNKENPRGSRRTKDEGSVRRSGRHCASRFACRLRQAHCRRDREVGQGGQVRGPQGGLSDDTPQLLCALHTGPHL